jgi:hypothetical protein
LLAQQAKTCQKPAGKNTKGAALGNILSGSRCFRRSEILSDNIEHLPAASWTDKYLDEKKLPYFTILGEVCAIWDTEHVGSLPNSICVLHSQQILLRLAVLRLHFQPFIPSPWNNLVARNQPLPR